MSGRPILLAFGLAFALTLAAGDAAAQACHDWDADGALSGWGCGITSDCLDLSWFTRPGAADVCDGLDNDCDGTLDATCDRYCDQPTLFGKNRELVVEGLPQAGRGCAGLTDRGFLAASDRVVGQTGLDALIYAREYDRLAVAWAASSAVGEPVTPSPSERRCEIATAGSRALIAYRDEQTRDDSTYRLKARVVDELGYPLGTGPIDLSATSPVSSNSPWYYFSPVWDGDRFVVFWTPVSARWNLLMSVIDPDGTLELPTVIVTDNIDGNSTTIQEIKAVWTGNHYLVAVTTDIGYLNPNLRVLNVSHDGVVKKNVGISTHADDDIDVALGNDRFVVAFSQHTAGQTKVFAAYFGLDGSYLNPPGTVLLYSLTGSNAPTPTDIRASWSGEMFGVAMASYTYEGGYVYSWRFWRLLPDGTNLDPGGILLAKDTSLEAIYRLIWAVCVDTMSRVSSRSR